MADLSITAANVAPVLTGVNQSRLEQVTYGATITAGMVVYLDTADSKWKIADNNVAALNAGSAGLGIAMCGGGNGQPGVVLRGGDVTIGATLLLGEVYALSDGAGLICPWADLAANTNNSNYPSVLGVAVTTSILRIPQGGPLVSGILYAGGV